MLETLKSLYGAFPEAMINHLGKDMEGVSPDLMRELRQHRIDQLSLLNRAHRFRLDEEAEDMLFRLIHELGHEGAEHVFHRVRMPFPVFFLERGAETEDGSRRAALVVQGESRISVQSFVIAPLGTLPSLLVLDLSDMELSTAPTPTLKLIDQISGTGHARAELENEAQVNAFFVKLAVSLATLLQHKGMLEVEDAPAFTRPERRRAEREGRPLPDTRVSVIRLGEAGRGQLAAMREGAEPGESETVARRAHWVRGHFMRTRSGELTWRMPHIRGAGPSIGQVRQVKV